MIADFKGRQSGGPHSRRNTGIQKGSRGEARVSAIDPTKSFQSAVLGPGPREVRLVQLREVREHVVETVDVGRGLPRERISLQVEPLLVDLQEVPVAEQEARRAVAEGEGEVGLDSVKDVGPVPGGGSGGGMWTLMMSMLFPSSAVSLTP